MLAANRLGALTTALLLSSTGVYAADYFNRVASFPVALNAPDADVTSSEIITATDDGLTLIYSDSPNGGIGFIDIRTLLRLSLPATWTWVASPPP